MQILLRIVGAVVGAVVAFPAGQRAGCTFYELTGPDYAQCGYEFEGIGHVLIAVGVLVVVFAFAGQWVAGRLWRRFRREI